MNIYLKHNQIIISSFLLLCYSDDNSLKSIFIRTDNQQRDTFGFSGRLIPELPQEKNVVIINVGNISLHCSFLFEYVIVLDQITQSKVFVKKDSRYIPLVNNKPGVEWLSPLRKTRIKINIDKFSSYLDLKMEMIAEANLFLKAMKN